MSDNDHLIRFEWSDFLVSCLYSTWSSTNTIFECISPLSFTFLFPFFPIFLCYTKIRENKFSHKFHISVAPTDNRHKNQLTTTTQCITATSCYHWHHCYCSFPLPMLTRLPLQIICLLLLQLFLLSADIAALRPICFLPPTLLLQCCRCRWLLCRCQHPMLPLHCMLTPSPPPPTRTRRGKRHSHGSTPREVVDAKTLTPPPLPSPPLNSGESNII
jgi:hypothetical protein